MKKQCVVCERVLLIGNFYVDRKLNRKSPAIVPRCKDCSRLLSKHQYSLSLNILKQYPQLEKLGHGLKTHKKYNYKRPYKYNPDYYKYRRNKKLKDIQFKIACRIRDRIYHLLSRKLIINNYKNDLGCTAFELIQHIELQFTKEMNWDNYGKWHIDHIIPLSVFDLTNADQLKVACHFSNLQPLLARDNYSKTNKFMV